MRFALSAGLLLAGAGAGLMARHDVPVPLVTVTVLVQFDESHSAPVYDAMRMEVDQIYLGTVVNLEWRLYQKGEQTPVMIRAVVAHMRGSCLATGPFDMQMADRANTLGLTHAVDGRLLPFVEVLCDNVRALAMDCAGHEPHQPEWVLGRALGRVLAHEMFHVLAETSAHADDGVVRRKLSRLELMSHHLGLDRKSVRKLAVAITGRHAPTGSQPTERVGF